MLTDYPWWIFERVQWKIVSLPGKLYIHKSCFRFVLQSLCYWWWVSKCVVVVVILICAFWRYHVLQCVCEGLQFVTSPSSNFLFYVIRLSQTLSTATATLEGGGTGRNKRVCVKFTKMHPNIFNWQQWSISFTNKVICFLLHSLSLLSTFIWLTLYFPFLLHTQRPWPYLTQLLEWRTESNPRDCACF